MNNRDAVGLNASNHVDARVLAAGVAESHVVPRGARYVLFSANTDFYAKFDGTAAVPAADVTDGSASVLNPGLRGISGVATIGLISSSICVVTMEFFS